LAAAGWNGLPRDRRGGNWLSVLARLKPGVTLAQAQAEMNTIQARLAQEHSRGAMAPGIAAVPLLQQTVGRNTRTALLVLWGVVAGVLLIACANVANLMLARAAARQKEIALRLSLGAGRWRVMRQLLTESIVLALLGAGVGTLLGYWGVKVFVAASPANIPRLAEVSLDAAALCFTVGAALLTGVIFGLAPAWQCSRPDLNETLKEASRSASAGVSAGKTRSGLVVAEVALATVLLVVAGLMLQSFARLLATDRGFRAERLLTVELDFSVAGFTSWVRPTETRPQVRLRELIDRVRQLPGVESAGATYRFLRKDNLRRFSRSRSLAVRPRQKENGSWPTTGRSPRIISARSGCGCCAEGLHGGRHVGGAGCGVGEREFRASVFSKRRSAGQARHAGETGAFGRYQPVWTFRLE